MNEIIYLENLDTTKLVFGEAETYFGGKDMLYRISVDRRSDDAEDETTPLYIHGVESKNPEEWCIAKLSVFEKDKRKNHSLQVAFQNKFPCQMSLVRELQNKNCQ
jgi:S-adenosylmethionine synthetase